MAFELTVDLAVIIGSFLLSVLTLAYSVLLVLRTRNSTVARIIFSTSTAFATAMLDAFVHELTDHGVLALTEFIEGLHIVLHVAAAVLFVWTVLTFNKFLPP